MPKLTIKVMGVKEEENIMNLIMQKVRRNGIYELPYTNNPTPHHLMANRMVSYGILNLNKVRKKENQDILEYTPGKHFIEALEKGAYNYYIYQKNIPSYVKAWQYASQNPLIVGVIVAIISVILTIIFIK